MMSHSCGSLSPELRALLERERTIPPLAAPARARALGRARAAFVVGSVPARQAPPAHRPWIAAAAMACVLSGAAGAAAYEMIRARFAPALDRPLAADPNTVVATPPAPPVRNTPIADAPTAPALVEEAPRASRSNAARAELRLLQLARAAVAREDFAAAWPPLAQHARRFRDGRLAEEREALRVKTLVGLGETELARRAAATFGTRFPRSVLLSAVSQMPASEP
jgi:hypothetical protein